jgi:hypothetical protein
MLMKKCPRCAIGLVVVAAACTCDEAFRLAEPEKSVTLYTAPADQPHTHDDGPEAPLPAGAVLITAMSTVSALSLSTGWRRVPASIASTTLYWTPNARST